jgi:hypothetical protein
MVRVPVLCWSARLIAWNGRAILCKVRAAYASGEASAHSSGERRLRHYRLELHQPSVAALTAALKCTRSLPVTAFYGRIKVP